MRKLLGKPVESSHDPTNIGITSSPIPIVYRPSAPQNAVYSAGVPIACLDKSPDGRGALLAGRHILKTVQLEGLNVAEGIDLRALIGAAQFPGPTRTSATTSVSDQLSIKDAKWGTKFSSSAIFTACANGRIFQYDLAKLGSSAPGGAGLEFVQSHEDSRQVNTLDINPHRGTYLLSGSQDGIVRCFDIRTPAATQTGLTFRAVNAWKGNADAIRHVVWSPKDGMEFACCTEQGIVMKFHLRKPSAPVLRINAHEKACASIAWHPDGSHLISGGSDKKCYVWDMSSAADKRQKPKYTISTPAAVASLAWRPGQWSATARGKRAAQVAVSYDESGNKRGGINTVHIWDLGRPTMPYKVIEAFDTSPSALLWHDQDLLWTAGQDGLFNQCDIAFAPKAIDRTPVSTMTFSSQGEVLMFLDERPQAGRPRLMSAMHHPEMRPASSYSSSPGGQMLSISRSDSEDDVVGSFLGHWKRAGRKRRQSARSSHTLSTTPPSGPGPDEHVVLPLEQSLKSAGMYKPQQAMAIGPVPAAARANVYGYLAANYLETLATEFPHVKGGKPMTERVAIILEHYARAAESVSQFRLAQTWRLLAYAMDLLLRKRGSYHREKRLRNSRSRDRSPHYQQWEARGYDENGRSLEIAMTGSTTGGDVTPRKSGLVISGLLEKPLPARSLLAEEIESTSNVPTPLARPVPDHVMDLHVNSEAAQHRYALGKKLTPVLEMESFALPPAAVHAVGDEARQRLDSMPLSEASHGTEDTRVSSTEGYDFYGTEMVARAIDVPSTRKKEPLMLDYLEPRSPDTRQPAVRQDSDESFAQLFSISQNSGRSNSSVGSVAKRSSKFETVIEHRHKSGSDLTDEEYQSRIRGKQIQDSPESARILRLRRTLDRANSNVTETSEDDYYRMITQTTSGSLASQGFASRSSDPDGAAKHQLPRHSAGPHNYNARSIEYDDDDEDESPDNVVETDYLPWPDDPPYPFYPPNTTTPTGASTLDLPPPLQPYTVLTRALSFETQKSALNASAMILLLKSLMPNDIIDPFLATAILRQHHARLMNMRLFVEAAKLRNLCVRGWPGGVLSMWGENYASIFSPAQHGVSVAFLCPKCRKPREIDRTSKSTDSVWRCERCHAVMGSCAVCGHRDDAPNLIPLHLTPLAAGSAETSKPDMEAAEEEQGLATWWYCPGCGHGGHSTCLEAWHSTAASSLTGDNGSPLVGNLMEPHATLEPGPGVEFSDGCCPLDQCGHACLPGRWRAETTIARSEELTRTLRDAASHSSGKTLSSLASSLSERDRRTTSSSASNASGTESLVRSDTNKVGQSRAVESARESLAGERDTSSILSSSPGRSLGDKERERRKSVKFVGTER